MDAREGRVGSPPTSAGTATAEVTTGGSGGPGDDRRPVPERARDAAAKAGTSIKEEFREKVREVEQKARRARDQVAEETGTRADSLSAELGRRSRGLARALRAASSTLESEGEGAFSEVAVSAAVQVDRMSDYLEDENPGGMLQDLEAIARNNPVAFLGTTFALGLFGGRFLRSSRPGGRETAQDAESDSPGFLTESGTYVSGSALSAPHPGETARED